MPKFYLIVGVDQEGDATWDIKTTLASAIARASEMNETAFDAGFAPMEIWEINPTPDANDDMPAAQVPYGGV